MSSVILEGAVVAPGQVDLSAPCQIGSGQNGRGEGKRQGKGPAAGFGGARFDDKAIFFCQLQRRQL